jgi:hypothetical protein
VTNAEYLRRRYRTQSDQPPARRPSSLVAPQPVGLAHSITKPSLPFESRKSRLIGRSQLRLFSAAARQVALQRKSTQQEARLARPPSSHPGNRAQSTSTVCPRRDQEREHGGGYRSLSHVSIRRRCGCRSARHDELTITIAAHHLAPQTITIEPIPDPAARFLGPEPEDP